MANLSQNKEYRFKYYLTFYYQSVIFYLVLAIILLLISEFVIEEKYQQYGRAIVYVSTIIMVISLISMLYNIYKNKFFVVSNKGLSIQTKFKQIFIEKDKIISIKYSKKRIINNIYGIFVIKIKNKKKRLIIRPGDYENSLELIKILTEFKEGLKKNNV